MICYLFILIYLFNLIFSLLSFFIIYLFAYFLIYYFTLWICFIYCSSIFFIELICFYFRLLPARSLFRRRRNHPAKHPALVRTVLLSWFWNRFAILVRWNLSSDSWHWNGSRFISDLRIQAISQYSHSDYFILLNDTCLSPLALALARWAHPHVLADNHASSNQLSSSLLSNSNGQHESTAGPDSDDVYIFSCLCILRLK